MTEKRAWSRPVCPKCGSTEVVRIVYGLPGPELLEEAKRGQIALGGCCVTGNDPQWHCHECGHRWRAGRDGRE
jgi:DNA-directed RNA polymerase subunit RPC12/RpoP